MRFEGLVFSRCHTNLIHSDTITDDMRLRPTGPFLSIWVWLNYEVEIFWNKLTSLGQTKWAGNSFIKYCTWTCTLIKLYCAPLVSLTNTGFFLRFFPAKDLALMRQLSCFFGCWTWWVRKHVINQMLLVNANFS